MGIIISASSTIGNGLPGGGLTIAGGATTTGNLFVQGDATTTNFSVTGALSDGTSNGTNGYVLQTTGNSVQWVATSSLGLTASAAWGAITGNIADQTDLQNALNARQIGRAHV